MIKYYLIGMVGMFAFDCFMISKIAQEENLDSLDVKILVFLALIVAVLWPLSLLYRIAIIVLNLMKLK